MEFWDVVRSRRSVRSYTDRSVDESLIEQMIEAARLAPSGGNCQPWRFYGVFDAGKRQELVACTYQRNNPESGPQAWLGQAPVLILVCRDVRPTTAKYDRWGRDFISLQDCAAAIENCLLAAAALGLGTCWIGGLKVAAVQEKFELPDYIDPLGLIAVGYAREAPPKKQKLSLRDIYRRI